MNNSKGGENSVFFTHTKYPSDTLDLTVNALQFPVFTRGKMYNSLISVFEPYTNIDNGNMTRVPVVNGTLSIDNNLSTEPTKQVDLSDLNQFVEPGKYSYSFTTGTPSLLENQDVPDYSFTKVFSISVDVGSKRSEWLPFDYAVALAPNPNKGEAFYRGYIFGSRAEAGTNFVVQGPSEVEYILRDPPGSNSSATLETGSVITSQTTWSVGGGVDASLTKLLATGTKFSTGLGYETITELTNNIGLTVAVESSVVGGEQYVESKTLTQAWKTSSNPNNIFTGSDLFIGQSRNYNFGVSQQLGIYSVMACDSNATVTCYGTPVDSFRIGTSKSMYIVPHWPLPNSGASS